MPAHGGLRPADSRAVPLLRYAVTCRSISEISSCFFGPRPWHIEIRHRVKKTSTMNLFGFETLKLKIRRLKLWKPGVCCDVLRHAMMCYAMMWCHLILYDVRWHIMMLHYALVLWYRLIYTSMLWHAVTCYARMCYAMICYDMWFCQTCATRVKSWLRWEEARSFTLIAHVSHV